MGFRGHLRWDYAKNGAASVFKRVLTDREVFIQSEIKKAKSENDINNLSKELCNDLLVQLVENIRADQLTSFNKIRKPMDIVIQHMVAMDENFFEEDRIRVIDLLFLPLDSQIFQSDFIFTDQEAKSLSIKRTFTFKDIKCESHYADIQAFLREKANRIGLKHRIYFDLLWNNRYTSSGTNLFLTNPNKST